MTINLEIDDELAAQLEAAARARGLTPREFLREALRHALSTPVPDSSKTTFVQKVHDFGAQYDTAWTRLSEVESDEYVKRFKGK